MVAQVHGCLVWGSGHWQLGKVVQACMAGGHQGGLCGHAMPVCCPPFLPTTHTSGMCNPWSCQFFGQTKPECHNYCHIPKYWHNHKNTKNVHGWHNTPNKTQSNGLRAGLGSWPHGVHRAMAMLCILHDLWRPWVRAVAAIVPHVGGSIVQKPTVGSPQKIFCAFMGH